MLRQSVSASERVSEKREVQFSGKKERTEGKRVAMAMATERRRKEQEQAKGRRRRRRRQEKQRHSGEPQVANERNEERTSNRSFLCLVSFFSLSAAVALKRRSAIDSVLERKRERETPKKEGSNVT